MKFYDAYFMHLATLNTFGKVQTRLTALNVMKMQAKEFRIDFVWQLVNKCL